MRGCFDESDALIPCKKKQFCAKVAVAHLCHAVRTHSMQIEPSTVVREDNDGYVGQSTQILKCTVRISDEAHVNEVVIPADELMWVCVGREYELEEPILSANHMNIS